MHVRNKMQGVQSSRWGAESGKKADWAH